LINSQQATYDDNKARTFPQKIVIKSHATLFFGEKKASIALTSY
jgi:hypothetical protein